MLSAQTLIGFAHRGIVGEREAGAVGLERGPPFGFIGIDLAQCRQGLGLGGGTACLQVSLIGGCPSLAAEALAEGVVPGLVVIAHRARSAGIGDPVLRVARIGGNGPGEGLEGIGRLLGLHQGLTLGAQLGRRFGGTGGGLRPQRRLETETVTGQRVTLKSLG